MRTKKLIEGWVFKSNNKCMEVSIPHDAMILHQRDANNINTTNTGYFPGEDCTYKTQIFIDKNVQQAFLEFDGVYKNAIVFVNGQYAGKCHYGYTNFLVDITPMLIQDSKNSILVQVHNSDEQNSRWYTGTGIYRDVTLHYGKNICVYPDGVKISVKDIENDLAVVEILANLSYVGDIDRKVWVKNEIFDNSRNLVACDEAPVTLQNEEKDANCFRQRYFVRNPDLWDTNHPFLYTCHTIVYVENEILDEVETIFGIRKIQLDPIHGFRLNGKTRKLRGGCIHHDNGVVGACDFADSEIRKISFLKNAGFDTVRISHHPASKAVLNACDRLGMMVMDESFDMWNFPKNDNDFHYYFTKDWEMVVDSLVRKDYNHPSVIMYSIGNEIQEIGTSLGGVTGRRIAERIRRNDSSRYITNAINGMMCVMDDMDSIIPMVFSEKEIAEKKIKRPVTDINYALTLFLDRTEKINLLDTVTDMLAESVGILDVTGYNYAAGRYQKEANEKPNRLTMGSETFPPEIGKNWQLINRIPQTIGDFSWTAWDYLGETGIGMTTCNKEPSFSQPYPAYMAYVGDFDITGFRRPMSYYREIVWNIRKDPYIAVWNPIFAQDNVFFTPWSIGPAVASWTWGENEGIQTRVEVYTNDEEIELFLNGKSLGRRDVRVEDACRVIYKVPYERGILKAVSYSKGRISGEFMLETAESVTDFEILMDKTYLLSGRNALCHLRINLVDSLGRRNMFEKDRITLQVSGAGNLQGMGNANPVSESNFFDTEWDTYEGSVFAVIRAGMEAGEIKVRISSQRFGERIIRIPVKSS